MTDEQFLLASAYVDGEVTDDERRTAESDPAVMAEVERLRATRSTLGRADARPPTETARRRALSAALDEFRSIDGDSATASDAGASSDQASDSAAATAESSRTATVTPIEQLRRQRAWRWVSAAAAIVAIGVGGVVVVGQRDVDDDGDGDAAVFDEMPDEIADDRFIQSLPADGEDLDEADDAAAPATEELASDDMAADDMADAAVEAADEAADEAPGQESGQQSGQESGDPERSALTGRIAADARGRSVERPIVTAEHLVDFAVTMQAAAANAGADEIADIGDRARACDVDEPLVADAFVNAGVDNATVVDAIVVFDPELFRARAIDPASCTVLLSI